VREAVARMHEAGVRGCVVTGRMYRAAVTFARELGFDTPVVCFQGAAIVDPQQDEVLRDLPLDIETVAEIVDVVERDGMHLQLYRNDEYYCEQRNRFSDLYAHLSGSQPVIVESLRETFAYSPATKAVVIDDPERSAAYLDRVREQLGARVNATRSYPEFVEILNPAVDKGDALRFVAERLGIDMSEVAAIGDSWNDVALLRASSLGIAMGSAPPELREVAHRVVQDVGADGVAEAIDRYILA
jgi:Cof subfamily protein (haloacid dehalogenase superfamily)